MNEIERIQKMVEAGTITDDEAQRLLSVLRDIDQADEELAASGAAMEAEARQVEALHDPAPAAGAATPAPAQAAATGQAQAARDVQGEHAELGAHAEQGADAGQGAQGAQDTRVSGAAPEGLRWVHVSLLAGDLSLKVDPEASEVMVRGDEGSVRVEPTEDGFSVNHVRQDGQDSWIDRFLSRIRSGHLELRIPPGHGVDLSVTAGDVEMRDVPYLRGRLTSGNLDARGLRGIDFTTAAGDLDLEMTLTEGRHSLRATAGDVQVRLGRGSDVTVDGSVSIGNASVRAPGFDVDRRGVGQRFRGRVGQGTARLDLHVTTGDVDVRADDDR
ncbi:MAG: DUF4097 family beta strand repeat-containing protein [Deinococcales bacterium]